MDLSIVIVSWNVRDKLKKNLEKIFASKLNCNFEVFVVDNASKDKTAEMVKSFFPQVKLIENQENLGFAKANNQALKEAKGKYLLLLNPDMQVKEDTLKNMLDWIKEKNKVGIAGCKLINEEGCLVPQVRNFPTFWNQLAIVLKIAHIFPWVLNKYIPKDFNYNQESEVDSIRGSFFLISRGLYKEVGGLDERYFIWFEEVDYCRQAKKSGWKVRYYPGAKCVDSVGSSFRQVPVSTKQKYFQDSMLKYFYKWHPKWQYIALKTVWPLGRMMAKIGGMVKFRSKN